MPATPRRRTSIHPTPSLFLAAFFATAVAFLPAASPAAEPYLPDDDAEVLERLPVTAADPRMRELRQLHAELRASPQLTNPQRAELAARVAWGYVELGRRHGEARYYGYAQAALAPWWKAEAPPPEVLLLRATLRQRRHDFDAALEDLEHLLALDPREPRAWLQRAVVLLVQGDPRAAVESCLPLGRLAPPLAAHACLAHTAGSAGRAREGYRLLRGSLEAAPEAEPELRQWALTTLAELALRLGEEAAADEHFRAALAVERRDPYLLGAYADFLLAERRAGEALALLEGEERSDALLLRRVLAEKAVGAGSFEASFALLAARVEEGRRLKDDLHLGEVSRYALELEGRPLEALRLAQQSWRLQKEPIDALRLLEAARAAARPAAARPVLEWLERTGLEDVRLAVLADELRGDRAREVAR